MSLTENGGVVTTMPVAPSYGGGFGNMGGDWAWILLLLLAFGGGGFGGFGGDGLYPWLNNSQNINGGFRDQMLNTGINGISDKLTSGFGDLQTSLCSGFAGVNATVNSGVNSLAQQLNTNAMASLERSFGVQSALQNCCCENRANIADLKYTVATENCADRAVVSDGIRDVIAATQAQTQAILNQLCADKIEAKNDTIAQLRSELLYARGQASQDVQTAAIQAGQRALANEVEQYVAPRPIPSYYVQNPNCCGYTGCGAA